MPVSLEKLRAMKAAREAAAAEANKAAQQSTPSSSLDDSTQTSTQTASTPGNDDDFFSHTNKIAKLTRKKREEALRERREKQSRSVSGDEGVEEERPVAKRRKSKQERDRRRRGADTSEEEEEDGSEVEERSTSRTLRSTSKLQPQPTTRRPVTPPPRRQVTPPPSWNNREPASPPRSISSDSEIEIIEHLPSIQAPPASQPAPPPIDPGPIIELLIAPSNSSFPSAQPIIVKRKLRQTLKLAFKLWLEQNGLAGEKDVVFVHRGIKAFDFATAEGLGVKEEDAAREGGVKIVIEVMRQNEWEKRSLEGYAGEDDYDAVGAGGDVGGTQEESQGPKLSLVLRARDKKPLTIRMAKGESIAKLEAEYKSKMSIPSSTKVRLQFEGDSLDPESTIGDIEIEPEDEEEDVLIDVLISS